ncbi:peptidoglycan D,D-transpeptidase FtsI family protein [Helicobacter monodelphidis]|uniref:peptidoglycan D,D-transpeptidase FtsI family protein n=1 Tax=Helicobacter sp. 15-1451 TaxID=2004995 RepID=UPI00215C83A8|nr:penicillin-binding protein 2 [Helicobacter sp. 15-1451]
MRSFRIESAIRGSIYSSDGFMLASSKKLYKAIVNTYNIDPQKEELFVNLFSIYSKIPRTQIRERLKKKGNVVLSYNLDSKTAANLKQLVYTLNLYNVFREYEDNQGRVFKYGLSILESGEKRDYLYENSMEPLIGYVRKTEEAKITKVSGVKGIEGSYNGELEPLANGRMEGARDIGFNLILNREAFYRERSDGYSLSLSVPLKLQKKIERLLDEENQRIGAKEVIAGIMDAESGKILALATTKRFDPNNITQDIYSHLNVSAVEYAFEPGSIVKPLIYAILLENNLLDFKERFPLYGGRYRIGDSVITDTHSMKEANAEDIMIFSSNIGMAQIAQKLSPIQYYDGLKHIGFSELSGIDLPYEQVGKIPTPAMFNNQLYKATVAYGYGLQSTFIQMLKAYNIITNNGLTHSPYIAEFLIDSNDLQYPIKHPEPIQVIRKENAIILQDMLIKTVQKGTGRGAAVNGVVVGGKTGTAHIAENGRYVNRYNSSFFGFAADPISRYTIGVVVLEPNTQEAYFSARTAVPVYKKIVELLMSERYLHASSVSP